MKISVSLPDDDVRFLDQHAERSGQSRSAALHQAVVMLRTQSLEGAYALAAQEWEAGDDAAAWDVVTGDGITDATQ